MTIHLIPFLRLRVHRSINLVTLPCVLILFTPYSLSQLHHSSSSFLSSTPLIIYSSSAIQNSSCSDFTFLSDSTDTADTRLGSLCYFGGTCIAFLLKTPPFRAHTAPSIPFSYTYISSLVCFHSRRSSSSSPLVCCIHCLHSH